MQQALARHGALDLLSAVALALSARPAFEEECGRAAAQLSANVAVGQPEALAALWRGEVPLLGVLLGSDRMDYVSVGVMVVFNCSRNLG